MNNSIKHILTPPYHPQSNRAAENMVGIFKDKIKKILDNENNVIQASCKFLLDYRNTVHCTTGKSPAELHLNRKLKNKFDLILNQFNNKTKMIIQENVKDKVRLSQEYQKNNYKADETASLRSLLKKDTTWLWDENYETIFKKQWIREKIFILLYYNTEILQKVNCVLQHNC
ncbi:uncharacterized protein LOC126900812 [Daktulosphaira vitifoliae]|uniref:uncharacterized protein LOC126900812 n=1 Tax=Daktulosphaira vitifoliae TaxID=58002 RepID=UPI0021A99B22|nr:uncharacterized protein LOC126900812 [Daktulosphaira vitifoliae]